MATGACHHRRFGPVRDREDGPERVRRLARALERPTIVMLFLAVIVGAIVGSQVWKPVFRWLFCRNRLNLGGC